MHLKAKVRRFDSVDTVVSAGMGPALVMQAQITLLKAWIKVLSLSEVRMGTTIALLRGSIANDSNVAAARLAAAQLDARMLVLEVDPYEAGANATNAQPNGVLRGSRATIEAMKNVDLVIDMMGMDRGHEQGEILEAGTRILLVKEPPETLVRLVPDVNDKERVLAATARLRRARNIHVTSDNGTDLAVNVGAYPCLSQYGYSDEPGHWDHWPGAFVATWPDEGSAQGTVVLSPGDAILPFKQYVRSPISLRIEDGYIRAIEGQFDARYLRDYMARFGDPEAYAVSHLGWGLYDAAHWTALGMTDRQQTSGMESRSFAGNFMFSTGPNTEAGGTRDTQCHLDIPMLDCTVELDGDPMVVAGRMADARPGSSKVLGHPATEPQRASFEVDASGL